MSEDTPKITENSDSDAPKWSHLPTIPFRKTVKKSLGEILTDSTSITKEQVDEALKIQASNEGGKLGEILIQKNLATEEDVLRALAHQLDLPYYNRLPVNDIDPGLVDSIPIHFCRDNKILPVARDDFSVTVAVADPLNIFPLDDLRLIISANISMVVTSASQIDNAINRVYERSNDSSQKVIDELNVPDVNADEDLDQARDLLESSDDEKPIIKLVHGLLARAVKEKASDIHIEPYESEIMVRFRIDGSLQDKMEIPRRHGNSLASRVKIMGKLNIAEKRVPQDGRISIKVAGKEIDVRLSVLPTAHGERIVMRLLDKSSGTKRLDQMGLDPEIYQQWTSLIEQSHGIILVTGPTGSGKTSLLYASLMHINTSDINILTIEDPVEYQLNGVGQIQVNDKIGMGFAEGLRSILRQDPDVIMIGEIRDATTAQIAIQSSMTGHLVLSTVHTNDTASTVTRLMDFHIQPFQITSAVLGVMATRLLRKLCVHCREAYVPSDRDLATMEISREQLGDRKIYKSGGGCERCQGIGYKDRMGVYELLVFDDDIREVISKTQDGKVIKKVATDKGLVSLRAAAFKKVLAGLTSIEEAQQNTQADDFTALDA
jgi:general secretion pathway protein E